MTQEQNLSLGHDFPEAAEKDWREAVGKALRGAPFETLQSRHNGLNREPLYTRGAAGLSPTVSGMPGQAPYLRGGAALSNSHLPWHVAARFTPGRRGNANADVLTDLEGGVSALLLDCRLNTATPAELDSLLDGVDLSIVPVFLRAGADASGPAEHLLAKAQQSGLCLDFDPLGHAAAWGLETGSGHTENLFKGMDACIAKARTRQNVRLVTASGVPYHNAGADAVTELAAILATAVHYMRHLETAGFELHDILDRLTLTVSADTDFFGSIAKIRALRLLWGGLCSAMGMEDGKPFVHAEGSERCFSLADPWVNMLRATISSLAAGIGGADVVTALPCTSIADSDNSLARRVARNTQIILQEESHIGQVMDPAGGSWYVEDLSEKLAAQSWALFQEIEKAGGMAAEKGRKAVTSRIEANRQDEAAALARREMPVLGAGDFANLEEALLKPRPSYGKGALKEARPAEPFEKLRFAAEPHRPKIYLAALGGTAEFTARANFATNLFAAGGIESHPGCGGYAVNEIVRDFETGGFSLAVICGTDKAYETHAAALAQALAEAGCSHVWLAGKHEAEGVDGHVHPGCDALSVLQLAHNLMGIQSDGAPL